VRREQRGSAGAGEGVEASAWNIVLHGKGSVAVGVAGR